MIIDLTNALAPLYWALLALLLFLAAAIFSAVRPEVAEVYLPQPRVQVATALVALVLLFAVLLAGGRWTSAATEPHGLGTRRAGEPRAAAQSLPSYLKDTLTLAR